MTTGDITLFTVGLPGLDFGKIFKIGPTFNIYAKADATFETNLQLDVDLAYTISNAQLVYPQPMSEAIDGESESEDGSTLSPGRSSKFSPLVYRCPVMVQRAPSPILF